jgi:hypothetical protein
VTGLEPLTLFELEPGMTEVISIAGAGVTVFGALAADLSWREDATDVVFTVVWAGLTASTTRPAMSTRAAATPVTTRDLLDTPSPRSLEQTELHQDQ